MIPVSHYLTSVCSMQFLKTKYTNVQEKIYWWLSVWFLHPVSSQSSRKKHKLTSFAVALNILQAYMSIRFQKGVTRAKHNIIGQVFWESEWNWTINSSGSYNGKKSSVLEKQHRANWFSRTEHTDLCLSCRCHLGTCFQLAVNQISHRRSQGHSSLCFSWWQQLLGSFGTQLWMGWQLGRSSDRQHCAISALLVLKPLDFNIFGFQFITSLLLILSLPLECFPLALWNKRIREQRIYFM